MELAFETKRLREICESEDKARQKLGQAVAEILKDRLADLEAATSCHDLPAGNPQPGRETGTMSVDLCDGHQIIFTHNHPTNAKGHSRKIDWSKVTRIKILRIEARND